LKELTPKFKKQHILYLACNVGMSNQTTYYS